MRQIFSQFGEVSNVFLKNISASAQSKGNTTWGFVTFDNPVAANTAMERINMNRTFGLQVKLAMSEKEKNDKRQAVEEQEQHVLEQQRKIEAFERTRGIGKQDYDVTEVLGKAKQIKVN